MYLFYIPAIYYFFIIHIYMNKSNFWIWKNNVFEIWMVCIPWMLQISYYWIYLRLCWAIIRIANCNIVIEETIFSCKCNNLQIRCFMYQNTNKWIYWSFLWPLTHRAHALNYTIYIKYMLSTNYFGRGWCLNGQILEQLLKLFCIRSKRSILQ